MDDFQQSILAWAVSEGLHRPKGRQAHGTRRKQPTLSDKLAAVLLLLRRQDGGLLIPRERRHSKELILSTPLQWDHIIALGLSGKDEVANFQPLATDEHQRKTAKDVARMAHNARLRKAREEREIADAIRRMLAPTPQALAEARVRKAKPKSKYKRKMNGKTVLREAA